jgi:ABC-2 type transport system ATP-binding protein
MCDELKCTLMLTSHDTDDIEMVCDRMILIKNGKSIVDDSVFNIKNNYFKKRIVSLVLGEKKDAIHFDGASLIQSSPYQLKYEIDCSMAPLHEAMAKFMQAYDLRDISIEGPSLESIINSFYTARDR